MEEWRPIKDYPNYLVSNLGNIMSLNFNKTRIQKILTPLLLNNYPSVILWNKDGKKTFYIHRLVAQEFIPNIENKKEIDHINQNKQDCRVNNLRWYTSSENKLNRTLSKISNINQKNISYIESNKLYQVQIQRNKKKFHKTFYTLEEAIKSRDEFLTLLDQSCTDK